MKVVKNGEAGRLIDGCESESAGNTKSKLSDIDGIAKLEPGKDSMKRLFIDYVLHFQRWFYFASFFAGCNKAFDLMPPVIMGWVVDIVNGNPPSFIDGIGLDPTSPRQMGILIFVLGFGVHLFESFFQWLCDLHFMWLAQHVQHKLRMNVYSHIQTRELEFFENKELGQLMAMLNDDVNQMERFLNTGFKQWLQLVILFVFSLPVLMVASWRLALVGLATFPLIMLLNFKYHTMMESKYTKVRQTVGDVLSRLENNISGIKVIKSFCSENFEVNRMSLASSKYLHSNEAAIRWSSAFVPMVRNFIALGFSLGLCFGTIWVMTDETDRNLSAGDLVLFGTLVQRILWPLTHLAEATDDFERTRSACKRTMTLLDTPSSIVDPTVPRKLDITKGGLAIQFKNVGFTYGRGLDIFTKLTIDFPKGKFIGVAGATGSGKSTLVKLLLRLYDVNSGSVVVGDIDIREMTLKNLRENIALVSQDVYIFQGCIFENIAYGRIDSNEEQVIAASKAAHLHDFVETLPDRYQTIVGERGIKLSGGQRQRLSLARAILKDAPVLVLDEATSSVDTRTEKLIQENLHRLIQGKTAIVIAHRLSTIRHADKIIVISDGLLAEEGTHDELIAIEDGEYADLWAIQSGDVAVEGEATTCQNGV